MTSLSPLSLSLSRVCDQVHHASLQRSNAILHTAPLAQALANALSRTLTNIHHRLIASLFPSFPSRFWRTKFYCKHEASLLCVCSIKPQSGVNLSMGNNVTSYIQLATLCNIVLGCTSIWLILDPIRSSSIVDQDWANQKGGIGGTRLSNWSSTWFRHCQVTSRHSPLHRGPEERSQDKDGQRMTKAVFSMAARKTTYGSETFALSCFLFTAMSFY